MTTRLDPHTLEAAAKIADRERARLEAHAESHQQIYGEESPLINAQITTAGVIAAKIREGA